MSESRISKGLLSRREFLRASALVTAGSLVAACPAPVTPPQTVGEAAPPAPPAEIVELSVIFPDRELVKKVRSIYIDTFNEKMAQEGKPWRIAANVGPATDTDYITKITVDASANVLTDVVELHSGWLSDFAAAGYLLDLTPYVEEWDAWEHFFPVLKEQATLDGRVRVIPGGTTFTFFYRKDVLAEAGIPLDQPKTWEDFYAICDQIATKTSAKPCGIPAATQWGGGTWGEGFRHVWLSFAEASEIYDEADGKWIVSSPGLLQAFQVYETLATNGWLTVDELLSPNPWEPIKYQQFPAGQTLIVTGGDWQWQFDWGPDGATPIEGLFEKVDRWRFPSAIGEPFVFAGMGWAEGISATTKAPEGAFEYLKHIHTTDVKCQTYPVYLGGPASRDDMAEACDYYRTALEGKMVEASEFFYSGRYLRPYPGERRIADGIARATESIISLQQTSEQAMDEFAQRMADGLGEENVKRL